MENTEALLEKIGSNGKYQIIISLLLFIGGLGNDFTVLMMSFLTTPPKGYYKLNGEISGLVDFDRVTCDKVQDNHDLLFKDKEHSVENWSYEFDLYCQDYKVMIIQFAVFAGYVLGLVLIKFLSRYNKENITKIILAMFYITTSLVFIGNYAVIVIMTLLHGICHVSNFLLRSTIITEATGKKNRSYHISFQIMTGIVMGIVCPFMYQSGIHYRYFYLGMIILQIINFVLLVFFLKVNPRFLVLVGEIDEAIISSLYIAKMNNKLTKDYRISTSTVDEAFSNSESITKLNIYSGDQLEKWIRESFQYSESTGEVCITVINESLEPEQAIQQDNIVVPIETDTSTELKNYLYLTVSQICFSYILYINVFEVNLFGNERDFELWISVSYAISFSLFCIFSFIMNTKLGRKGTFIISVVVCLILRLTCSAILMKFPIYLYAIMRSFSNATQIPMTTLLQESFTNKARVSLYTNISLIVQILVLLVPIFNNIISLMARDILYMIFCAISIVIICFAKETSKMDLKDK